MKLCLNFNLFVLLFFCFLTARAASDSTQVISSPGGTLFSDVGSSSEFNRLTNKAAKDGSVQVIVALNESLSAENIPQSLNSKDVRNTPIKIFRILY